MICKQCNKSFYYDKSIKNKKLVKLYYFDKTFYFCSNDCYYRYSKHYHPSYWQWIKKYYSLSENEKKIYQKNVKKIRNQIKQIKEKYGDAIEALRAPHDAIWSRPSKPTNWFSHISEYNSFTYFKKAVIHFLKKETLKSILKDSWSFYCRNDYRRDFQLKQIKAINKVLDEVYGNEGLYGKIAVQWGFLRPDDKHIDKYNKDNSNKNKCDKDKSNQFWGPYIEIDKQRFFLFFLDKPYRYTLNTFIKRRLQSEK